jgi:phage terminase large subunit-like protein
MAHHTIELDALFTKLCDMRMPSVEFYEIFDTANKTEEHKSDCPTIVCYGIKTNKYHIYGYVSKNRNIEKWDIVKLTKEMRGKYVDPPFGKNEIKVLEAFGFTMNRTNKSRASMERINLAEA